MRLKFYPMQWRVRLGPFCGSIYGTEGKYRVVFDFYSDDNNKHVDLIDKTVESFEEAEQVCETYLEEHLKALEP